MKCKEIQEKEKINLKLQNKKKVQKLKEKGITLIALVVTIIILLILAGVTLNMALSGDGLFNKAKLSAKKYDEASEEEALKFQMLSMQLNGNDSKIGTSLYDKNGDNINKWHLIIENENNNKYGTGWRFIKKGTKLEENVIAKYSWIINDNTGEMKKLEEGKYTELSYLDSLGVEEGLIFNFDSSIIENGENKTIEELQKELGSNVELKGFDDNKENSGLTESSFNLDGIDDYIEINYNSKEDKKKLSENGITFEFYGILDRGRVFSVKTNSVVREDNWGGLFCYYDGNELQFPQMRFWLNPSEEGFATFMWSLATTLGNDTLITSDNMEKNSGVELGYNYGNIEYKKVIPRQSEVYVTFTLDCSRIYKTDNDGEHYLASLYINGEKRFDGRYNKKLWDSFVKDKLPNLSKIDIGRNSAGVFGYWQYSKMNLYSNRLYARALSEEEVKLNYDKTKAYRNLILNK